ncbi:Uncharacterised protein [Bordetella pertussis]|nr:Uncharacterised protein [Bordetella pertussis]CFO71008.1 Uncharacterised protein [Bordetella pertussis]CFP62737.1 Uncharacterised protein [Bordetella pertussis]CFU82274.1 Uncharacterised protein [Bordetella pertussis]CPI39937.1 Uncharacterised protein [Bordetella pertussis]
MLALDHAVQADDFAGQMKTGDLQLPAGILELRLERAEAHAVDGVQGIVEFVERFAALHAHALLDEFVQFLDFVGRHAYGDADVPQHAAGTVCRIR